MRALATAMFMISAWAGALAADPSLVLTFDGYGAVRFGMTVTEAEHALGGSAAPGLAGTDEQACHYTSFAQYSHARFMVEEGHITRVELDKVGRNELGIKVGMRLAEVRRRFPQVAIRPHKYDEAGHYLIFASASGKSEILAEESAGRVTRIRGGLLPAVEYVESCS